MPGSKGWMAAMGLLVLSAQAQPCEATYGWLTSDTFANAPVRSSFGRGEILTGVVRSSRDCKPIANARVVFWMHNWTRQDDLNEPVAVVFSDRDGVYRFETDPPRVSFAHLHIFISAPGFHSIQTNYYPFPENIRSSYSFPRPLEEAPPQGQQRGHFDLVLVPIR